MLIQCLLQEHDSVLSNPHPRNCKTASLVWARLDWGHAASPELEISTWSPRDMGALSVSSSATLNCCHCYVLEKVSELFEHIESMGGSWLILEAQLLVLIILTRNPTHQGSLQHKGETVKEIEGKKVYQGINFSLVGSFRGKQVTFYDQVISFFFSFFWLVGKRLKPKW